MRVDFVFDPSIFFNQAYLFYYSLCSQLTPGQFEADHPGAWILHVKTREESKKPLF